MDTPKEYSERIHTVASISGMTLDEIKARVDINGSRMDMLWNGKARPEASEELELAHALDIHPAVLQSEIAKKLWVRLKEITREQLFSDMWPKLAQQTGQRAVDYMEVDDALIDALILGNSKPSFGIQITLMPVESVTE